MGQRSYTAEDLQYVSAVDHWGPQFGDEKHLPVVFQCPAWQYLRDRDCVMVMHAHSLHTNFFQTLIPPQPIIGGSKQFNR